VSDRQQQLGCEECTDRADPSPLSSLAANAAPRYVPGNAFNLCGSSVMLILAAGLWAWQVRENRAKANGRDDWRIEGKTQAEIEALGQKLPGFRYSY